MISRPKYCRRIKWGYATHRLQDLPFSGAELKGRLQQSDEPPQANDVIVAEVGELGRHARIELTSKRRAHLFQGDLVGMVYGRRYATRQFEGAIPDNTCICHILSVGGVCGEVVGMSCEMQPPTILYPLGYLVDGASNRVNLKDYALTAVGTRFKKPTTILIVGSAMDCGKTTAAHSVVHGLTRSGAVVCAAKLTGTASLKDLLLLEDAGAVSVVDFTDMGHASTAMCDRQELQAIATGIVSNLLAHQPQYLVLEIADGVVQRETEMVLGILSALRLVDHVIYACHDPMGVAGGLEQIGSFGMNVVAISGWVACSPLAAKEAQTRTEVPVIPPEALQEPEIVDLFTGQAWAPRLQERPVALRQPVEIITRR